VAVGRDDADLRDRAATSRLFERLRPEFVIHAAAVGGGIGWMKLHPATSLSGNVLAAVHVLDAAQRCGVRRLVGVSSACAYGRDAPQPMEESTIFDGEPEPTNGPYGHSKRLMMRHGAALHEEFGFDCAFGVPTNLYGPGESFNPHRSHVVGGLTRRLELARRAQEAEVVCWGTGRATRDLMYAPDAAELLVRLLERGGGPAPVNIGSGVERPVSAIAAAIAEAVGYHGLVRFDATSPDGMPRKVLSVSLMQQRLGPFDGTPFDQGLRETVGCFRSTC
jgi:GDP-L-fucose synthase